MGGLGHKWVMCVVTHLSIYDPFIYKLIIHYQPNPQTQKMAETPLPPKKWLKYPRSKKNNWNTIEAWKRPQYLESWEKTKFGRNIIQYSFENDWNIPKSKYNLKKWLRHQNTHNNWKWTKYPIGRGGKWAGWVINGLCV